MITKNMASPTSEWMRVRNSFEKVYDEHIKDYFLDSITTAYITQKVDYELILESAVKINAGAANEEMTVRAVWHRCHHDTGDQLCEAENEI